MLGEFSSLRVPPPTRRTFRTATLFVRNTQKIREKNLLFPRGIRTNYGRDRDSWLTVPLCDKKFFRCMFVVLYFGYKKKIKDKPEC